MTFWPWLAGLAAGITISAVLGITVTVAGQVWPEDLYWQVVVVCTFAWPVVEYVPASLATVTRTLADAVRYVRPAKATPAPPPPPQPSVTVNRMVPVNAADGTTYVALPERRTARWLKWQRFSEELRVWYLERGSLLSGDLVGKGRGHAFANAEAWGLGLAEWDRLGLASKVNGLPTRLLVTPEDLALRLARGDLEWTDEHDPPPLRPAPREEVLMGVPVAERAG